jgi:hypothetical protein
MSEEFPYRLRVLRLLTEALQEITPANGYVSDVSKSVFRGRSAYGDTDPLPMLSILEVPIPLEQFRSPVDSSQAGGPWDLIIQGFVDDDRYNPTDPAHILLADVKQRLAKERTRLNDDGAFGLRTITRINIGQGIVRPPDEISAKAYFWLGVAVVVVEDLLKPYD